MFTQTFKNIDDVLWKEAGCSSELDYTEQSSWMLFLKYLDDLEQERAIAAELVGKLPGLFNDEDELRTLWGQPNTRKALLDGLAEKGFGEEQLAEARSMINAENSDVFDVLAYIAFALSPISREERVDTHKGEILTNHEEKQQAFLEFVLGEYIKEGVGELDLAKLPGLLELKYGNAYDAAEQLGGAQLLRETFVGFQEHLYKQKQDNSINRTKMEGELND